MKYDLGTISDDDDLVDVLATTGKPIGWLLEHTVVKTLHPDIQRGVLRRVLRRYARAQRLVALILKRGTNG